MGEGSKTANKSVRNIFDTNWIRNALHYVNAVTVELGDEGRYTVIYSICCQISAIICNFRFAMEDSDNNF